MNSLLNVPRDAQWKKPARTMAFLISVQLLERQDRHVTPLSFWVPIVRVQTVRTSSQSSDVIVIFFLAMDTLPAELVVQIVVLTNRTSKEVLSSTNFPWRPIALCYRKGEFDLSINIHVNSVVPSLRYDVSIKRLLSGSSSPWNEAVAKDDHMLRDVHLSIENSFWRRDATSDVEEGFRFIRNVFALARHGRRMHLKLNVHNNGEDPPRQCEILRRLLDLIPRIPVSTVDRHNAIGKELFRSQVVLHYAYDVLEETFERLGIPFMPPVVYTLLDIPVTDDLEIVQADRFLEKYYLRYQLICPDRDVRVRLSTSRHSFKHFATFPDPDTLLLDFALLRSYQENNIGPMESLEAREMQTNPESIYFVETSDKRPSARSSHK
uniref:Uncharacterized protein n=1 Tax=Steinernema glaseri TaxID=37863 RepID=A0A1I7Y6S9_9BILA